MLVWYDKVGLQVFVNQYEFSLTSLFSHIKKYLVSRAYCNIESSYCSYSVFNKYSQFENRDVYWFIALDTRACEKLTAYDNKLRYKPSVVANTKHSLMLLKHRPDKSLICCSCWKAALMHDNNRRQDNSGIIAYPLINLLCRSHKAVVSPAQWTKAFMIIIVYR